MYDKKALEKHEIGEMSLKETKNLQRIGELDRILSTKCVQTLADRLSRILDRALLGLLRPWLHLIAASEHPEGAVKKIERFPTNLT